MKEQGQEMKNRCQFGHAAAKNEEFRLAWKTNGMTGKMKIEN